MNIADEVDSASPEKSEGELVNCSLVSTFVHVLSHKLRTPLSVAFGALNDLADGFKLDAEEIVDGRDAIKQVVAVLDNLVSGVRGTDEQDIETSLQLHKLIRTLTKESASSCGKVF